MPTGISDELTSFDQRAVIKVCGIGGGGGNAVMRMIEAGLDSVDFIAINTDSQALKQSPAATRLQIGAELTGGLGSGAKPDVGRKAAMEDKDRIVETLRGADMIFLTAGLGGGTGTGASPIVAEAALECDALVVAIVTMPFAFEGPQRMENALQGLQELEERVDTIIVVPNDRVAKLCQNNVSLKEAFRQADEVLHNGVRAITDLITIPGLMNVDFADVRTVMEAKGRALMGVGVAEGEDRAKRAAEEAIVCPLLEQSSIDGAKGVIVNIKAGSDLGIREIQEAGETVQCAAHPGANIIIGAVVDDEERAEFEVTVIAAGFPKPDTSAITDAAIELPVRESKAEPTEHPVGEEPVTHERPLAVGAEGLSQAEPEVVSSPEPEIQYLFPEAANPAASKTPEEEPEEDLSIPAFMRNRKRKR